MENQRNPNPTSTPHPLITALLVEDEEVWATILTRYLSSRGCDVTWMRSATGVLPFILDVDPDLIMVDLKLPDMKGPELVESIARLGPETTARTAIVTGYPTVAKTRSAEIRIIDKADLTSLGAWIDEVLRSARHQEMIPVV